MQLYTEHPSWRLPLSSRTRRVEGEKRSFSNIRPYQARPAVNLDGLAAEIRAVAADTSLVALRGALEAIAEDVLRGERVACYLQSLTSSFRASPHASSLRSLAQDAAVLEDQR